ncbi:hypothetical protein BC940DRAFT_297275 [Gongronella butleri]|nr:hypothetical protein BC940DRAFT_297275 [Gongronella butleri]
MITAEEMDQVIDTHVHFFLPQEVHTPWVKGTMFENGRNEADYCAAVSKTGVSQGVYVEVDVEPTQGLAEAAVIRAHIEEKRGADENGRAFGGIGAVVAYVPMDKGEQHVRGYLRELQTIVGTDLLRGVRFLLQSPNSAELMGTDTFRDALRVLGEPEFQALHFELVIDSRQHPAQFDALLAMVRACPSTRFVLDHMAKPPCSSHPGQKAFDAWAENMQQLAQCRNVVMCKVSGLLTELDGAPMTTQQLAPFVQAARNAFGIDRLCFGGDWPILHLQQDATWQKWVDLVRDMVANWSHQDQHKLFVANAVKYYKLHH